MLSTLLMLATVAGAPSHDVAPSLDVDTELTLAPVSLETARYAQGGRVATGAFIPGRGGVAPMGKQLGIGIQIGFPTSLTLKYMLTGDQGLVFGVGAGSGFFFEPLVSFHVDYLWHPHVIVRAPPFKLSWFIGAGGWALLGGNNSVPLVRGYRWYIGPSNFWLAARLPIGLNFAFNNIPIEIYLNATPALLILPEVAFGLGGTLGARFYF